MWWRSSLIALAVPNLSVYSPGGPSGAFETQIIQFHQDFYLGPANSLLGGRTMLVDVFSQYGVGSILFLAGVFKVFPIAYGTLALTEGVLAAGMFCLAYVTLRLAGVGRVLAWAAFAVALVVLVFNLLYPLGGLLQHGAFRFGMPMLILVAAARETRAGPRGAACARGHSGRGRRRRLAVVVRGSAVHARGDRRTRRLPGGHGIRRAPEDRHPPCRCRCWPPC